MLYKFERVSLIFLPGTYRPASPPSVERRLCRRETNRRPLFFRIVHTASRRGEGGVSTRPIVRRCRPVSTGSPDHFRPCSLRQAEQNLRNQFHALNPMFPPTIERMYPTLYALGNMTLSCPQR